MPSSENKPASLLRNPFSMLGILIAIASTTVGLTCMAFDIFFANETNPYIGILTYMILPGIAVAGTALSILGAFWEGRRRRRHPELPIPPWPRVDLNIPRHRIILTGVFAAILVSIILVSVTAYRAYNFTDSVKFCGEVCHSVMNPEFTAYQLSPHARVACVSCHVGPGAGGFVRSKITGMYQVYSLALHKYQRPIPTPVESLRPAQETCEHCHWPAKFFGAQQKTFNHYLADEKNSPWQIQMLLKIGGGDPRFGSLSGIHWHVNPQNVITYVATDKGRQNIPWVKVVDREGHVTEYMSTDNPLTPAELSKASVRRMDCVDCHNRPSHIFQAPDRSVEQALADGRIDATLPYIKREAMRTLAGSYRSPAEARAAIQKGLSEFYEKNYPRIALEKGAAIRQATDVVQQLFSVNVFPEMKADWQAHPNQIGHLIADGCFRCHDGLHKTSGGKTITQDCNACHTILAQGPNVRMVQGALRNQNFRHPVNVGFDVSGVKCSQCHNGTMGL
jgi:hypothetical protein